MRLFVASAFMAISVSAMAPMAFLVAFVVPVSFVVAPVESITFVVTFIMSVSLFVALMISVSAVMSMIFMVNETVTDKGVGVYERTVYAWGNVVPDGLLSLVIIRRGNGAARKDRETQRNRDCNDMVDEFHGLYLLFQVYFR